MNILIIGASGFIGKNLKVYFEDMDCNVIGTSLNNSPVNDLIYYDSLNRSLSEVAELSHIDYAIICSAVSNINACKINEDSAYATNVVGNIKIIEECFNNNVIPVFLSTDNVFSGERGKYIESDATDPVNTYGSHKKIIEDYLLTSGKNYVIARLSKVYSIDPKHGTFLTSLISDLMSNRTIYCATDQKFCPIYIDDLIGVLYLALLKNLRGLFNIASTECFSRYEFALLAKESLKLQAGTIIPCLISDIESQDTLPRDISMSNSKIIKATGHGFVPFKTVIKKVKNNINISENAWVV